MLDELAKKYGTDKSSLHHGFASIYEIYLSSFKYSKISVIECGVGGYQYPDRGGESLRMWYEYFPNAKLIGIDIHPKEGIINDRTEFWEGSQTDRGLLSSIIERESGAERRVFIDDASHVNPLTIETFNIVFPLLKSGDLYFVEDVHSSYWNEHGFEGDTIPLCRMKQTTMRYFSELAHQLNGDHFAAEYRNEFYKQIKFIHFYKEIIVLEKA